MGLIKNAGLSLMSLIAAGAAGPRDAGTVELRFLVATAQPKSGAGHDQISSVRHSRSKRSPKHAAPDLSALLRLSLEPTKPEIEAAKVPKPKAGTATKPEPLPSEGPKLVPTQGHAVGIPRSPDKPSLLPLPAKSQRQQKASIAAKPAILEPAPHPATPLRFHSALPGSDAIPSD